VIHRSSIDRPEIALGWLRRPKVRALLTELAAGQCRPASSCWTWSCTARRQPVGW